VCRGSLPSESKFVQFMCLIRMVTRKTRGLYWFGPLRINNLHPICGQCIRDQVCSGGTNWLGQGAGPKSLQGCSRVVSVRLTRLCSVSSFLALLSLAQVLPFLVQGEPVDEW
jgi:hypothetical protein